MYRSLIRSKLDYGCIVYGSASKVALAKLDPVWDMIRKITGKNVASPMHHLKDDNGTLITDRVEIANTLGAAIEKSSSSNKKMTMEL